MNTRVRGVCAGRARRLQKGQRVGDYYFDQSTIVFPHLINISMTIIIAIDRATNKRRVIHS